MYTRFIAYHYWNGYIVNVCYILFCLFT